MSSASTCVDVLMSIYRPEKDFFEQQLRSIAKQKSDASLRLIVRNDDPSDIDREQQIRDCIDGVPLKYIHGSQNLGYVKSFEELVKQANSEYIFLSDQDDVWLPNRGEETLSTFREENSVLCICDRSIIDQDNNVICESYRHAHPSEAEVNWNSGDDITVRAASSCYGIGMALAIRTDVAKKLVPFPAHTAHDLWLTLGASELGRCSFIDKPLVQYRRHGSNVSGAMTHITCKEDWYRIRVASRVETAKAFKALFPDSAHAATIWEFAQARSTKSVRKLYKLRNCSPTIARYEILLRFCPDWAFRLALRLLAARRK